jgi:mannan endo-1,4-beta-mannosidase
MFAFDEVASLLPDAPDDAAERLPLPWIRVAPGAPYFVTESGDAWTPIGHNDALAWPPLTWILKRPDAVDAYFRMLQMHGVTCLRLMLEYSQRNHHFLERPVGRFQPRMVDRWDGLFALAEKYRIRLLLTPFDTFWMWKRWKHHPYNAANGGPCRYRNRLLTSSAARTAIKHRLAFVIDRWGGSGALFGWDLWNEIHPAYAQDDVGHFHEFIAEIATFVRERERAQYGRVHPITVSAFGPMLHGDFGSRELGHTTLDPRAIDAVFRHDALDFATVHTYAHGTIDDPSNTVDAAIAMGALTRASIAAIHDCRPFLDSEHGPIHTFKDRRRVLPEHFDDEYFRHLQWAHLASGAAGGGMRWPNRRPHVLTAGMHAAQHALVSYLPLLDWPRFGRRNLNAELAVSPAHFAIFGCGDARQAAMWVVRRHPLAEDGTVFQVESPDRVAFRVPGLADGRYRVTTFNTEAGVIESQFQAASCEGVLPFEVPVLRDLALAIQPAI